MGINRGAITSGEVFLQHSHEKTMSRLERQLMSEKERQVIVIILAWLSGRSQGDPLIAGVFDDLDDYNADLELDRLILESPFGKKRKRALELDGEDYEAIKHSGESRNNTKKILKAKQLDWT
jgi:hypothetical protein